MVIGQPGSGRSTLLKALANRTDSFAHVLGERYYNNLGPLEVQKQRGDNILYYAESHFPQVTVEETIVYAAKVRSVYEGGSQHIKELTNILLTVFGLRYAHPHFLHI